MADAKQYNLNELVSGLAAPADDGSPAAISEDMRLLIERGLHHMFLPETLQPKAAEMFQMAADGIGGLPRLLQWADRNPTKFYQLYARMMPQTIAPVLPQQIHEDQVWPEWLSHRRLAYQEDAQYAEDVRSKEANAEPDPEG